MKDSTAWIGYDRNSKGTLLAARYREIKTYLNSWEISDEVYEHYVSEVLVPLEEDLAQFVPAKSRDLTSILEVVDMLLSQSLHEAESNGDGAVDWTHRIQFVHKLSANVLASLSGKDKAAASINL